MKKYEVMIIVNASLDEEQVSALETRLFAPILENGGSIDKVDDWGVREFAYEINHMKKGHYLVVNCSAGNTGIEEFQRLCRINNNVVRILVVKKEDER